MPKQASSSDKASERDNAKTLTSICEPPESGQSKPSDFEKLGKFTIPKCGWGSVLISEDHLESNH